MAGRRPASARGSAKRTALAEAATDLLREGGFGAVSHRAVAQRARLPLAATTYYFESLDELILEALARLCAAWLEASRAVLDRLPARLESLEAVAEAAVRLVATGASAQDGEGLTAQYERYLEAGRRPALRRCVAAYDAALDQLVAELLARGGLPATPAHARLLLAVVDGALVRALAEGAGTAAALSPVSDLLRAWRPLTADA